jgi:hypothetical protein
MKNTILAVILATAGVAFAADAVKVEAPKAPATVAPAATPVAPAVKVGAPKAETVTPAKKAEVKPVKSTKTDKPVAKDEKAAISNQSTVPATK